MSGQMVGLIVGLLFMAAVVACAVKIGREYQREVDDRLNALRSPRPKACCDAEAQIRQDIANAYVAKCNAAIEARKAEHGND